MGIQSFVWEKLCVYILWEVETFIYTLRREILSKSKGTIKFFNVQKGFGFITPDNGGKDLFVHANNVHGDPKSLREGQKVEFVEGPGRKGPEATDVRII